MKEVQSGICYLTGAGPGDVGLVTLKARECIEQAEVLVYDYLCNPVLLTWAPKSAEVIYAGKKAGAHVLKQEEINALLVKHTRAGKRVVRLKGGDPFVFGRGGEEAQALAQAGLKFEIVPGISSAIAGPAYAGIPVTHRGYNTQLTIFTGHENPEKEASGINYAQIAKTPGTKVMLMGVERLAIIAEELQAHGMKGDTPVALVRWATTGKQETLVSILSQVAEEVEKTGFTAPAVAIFGGVVELRKELNWFEERPLFGKKVVVTRTRRQAGELSRQLAELGADVYEIPTIRMEAPTKRKLMKELISDAHHYDWLVFTSPNGVDAFFEEFFQIYKDVRAIGGARIAVIGPGTAAKVRQYHLDVDLIPDQYVAEEIVKKFHDQEGSLDNLKMLVVRPEVTRDVLSGQLSALGAIVDECLVYRTVPEKQDPTGGMERFQQEPPDIITFTSSSTVERFLDLELPFPEGVKIASIGAITSTTLREKGITVDMEASENTIPGLVKVICEYYQNQENDLKD